MGGGASKPPEIEPIVVPILSKQGVTLALLKQLEQLSIQHHWTTTAAVINGFVIPATETMYQAKLDQIKAAAAAKAKEKQGGNKGKHLAVAEVVEMSPCSIEGLMKDYHTDTPHPTLNLTYNQCFATAPTATLVFVSHCRDQPFTVLVSSLESFVNQQHAQKPGKLLSFWIDFLAIDERENKATYPIEWYTDTFPSHLAAIGRTVVVVSPGHQPTALSNLKCLYEMLMSLKPPPGPAVGGMNGDVGGGATGTGNGSGSGKACKLYFPLCPTEREVFVDALENDFAGLLKGWSEVDMRGAQSEGVAAGAGER